MLVYCGQISAHVYCGQAVAWIKMKLGTEVGLGPAWPHCVRWKTSSPPPKGHSPQLSAHVCCDQTAGWIKMALGMEVGLDPGDIVRWGPSPRALPPPKTGSTPPIYGPCLFWPNGRPSQLMLSTCTNGRPKSVLLTYVSSVAGHAAESVVLSLRFASTQLDRISTGKNVSTDVHY